MPRRRVGNLTSARPRVARGGTIPPLWRISSTGTLITTLAVLARGWSERLTEAVAQGFIYTFTLQLSASIMLPEGGALWAINFEL